MAALHLHTFCNELGVVPELQMSTDAVRSDVVHKDSLATSIRCVSICKYLLYTVKLTYCLQLTKGSKLP